MKKHKATNPAQMSETSQELVIIFELVAEGGENDPALLNALGHETVTFLQQKGYTALPPVYTGQKGIESFLVEFVVTAQQIAVAIWDNHVAIAEGVADLSGLVTIFGGILPMLKRMRQIDEKQVGNKEIAIHAIKITVEIDGKPLVIETSDVAQADAALQLALKYPSTYPTVATQVTMKSKIKVQGRVPAPKRRPRR